MARWFPLLIGLTACSGTTTASLDGDVPADLAVRRPDDPCALAGGCAPGKWVDVTPPNVDLTDHLSCDNFGTETVQVDPAHPEQLYALFSCQGIWRSTDYGQTWTGPLNQGDSADCAGGITIPPVDTASPPVLYQSCIRGKATGFSRSTNGGVDWTRYDVNVPGSNNQFYPPAVDPYDPKHLLLSGHGVAVLAESSDGGLTWSEIVMASDMKGGATVDISFIDTGVAATTHDTWLSIGQAGNTGTWRTTTGRAGGAGGWQQVETNTHPPGIGQIYQPDTGGVVYMTGLYSKLGFGVFRSTDYGATWAHFGDMNLQERVVFGTAKNVYAMMGNEVPGTGSDPAIQVAAQPGTAWAGVATPPGMTQGPLQVAVTSDGQHSIVVLANWTAGLWRYVEP